MSAHGFDITVDFKRDRWGRPLIDIPGSDKPKGYTRISGYGQVLENQSGLTKWKQRMVLAGALERPDILKLASAARHDDKRMSSLAEELLEAGGASRAANTGTAIHDVLAQIDMGEITLDQVPDEFKGHAQAWQDCLDAHGLEIVTDLVECQLVNDTYEAAGSGDNFLRRKSDGKLIAVDKKTGKTISPRPLAYMVQLYLYATSMRYDVQTGQRKSIGNVDTTVAYIAHIPANGDTCVLYEVDLRAAAELTALACQVRKADKETVKVSPLAIALPSPAVDFDAVLVERRTWLRQRLVDLVAGYPECRTMLVQAWPTGVPGFKENHNHNHDEVDLIAKMADRLEAQYGVPFGPTDPKVLANRVEDIRAEALVIAAFPEARLVDDVSEIDDATYQAVKTTVDALPTVQQAWIGERTKEAGSAKKSLSLRQSRTVGRYESVQALIALSVFHDADDVVRALIELVVTDAKPTSKLGALLGGLNLDQALQLQKISHAIDTGALTLTWNEQAEPIVAGDVPAVLAGMTTTTTTSNN
jgi:hypothetical protein